MHRSHDYRLQHWRCWGHCDDTRFRPVGRDLCKWVHRDCEIRSLREGWYCLHGVWLQGNARDYYSDDSGRVWSCTIQILVLG